MGCWTSPLSFLRFQIPLFSRAPCPLVSHLLSYLAWLPFFCNTVYSVRLMMLLGISPSTATLYTRLYGINATSGAILGAVLSTALANFKLAWLSFSIRLSFSQYPHKQKKISGKRLQDFTEKLAPSLRSRVFTEQIRFISQTAGLPVVPSHQIYCLCLHKSSPARVAFSVE